MNEYDYSEKSSEVVRKDFSEKIKLLKLTEEKPKDGSFADKCIKRWALLGPYDSSISEGDWEKYYNMRDELENKQKDIHIDEGYGDEDGDDQEKEEKFFKRFKSMFSKSISGISSYHNVWNVKNHLTFPIDFRKKAELILFCGEKNSYPKDIMIKIITYMSHGYLPLPEKFADGLYYKKVDVNWEDEDCVRTFETNTVLFSPFGLHGFEMDYKYHYRARYSFSEHFHFCNIKPLIFSSAIGEYPEIISLCEDSDEKVSEYFVRKVCKEEELNFFQDIYFGQRLCSSVKMMEILLQAGLRGTIDSFDIWPECIAIKKGYSLSPLEKMMRKPDAYNPDDFSEEYDERRNSENSDDSDNIYGGSSDDDDDDDGDGGFPGFPGFPGMGGMGGDIDPSFILTQLLTRLQENYNNDDDDDNDSSDDGSTGVKIEEVD